MCDRPQMGSESASSREQVDTSKTVYALKIRGGCEVDSKGKKAGKGALIQENLSATLGVSQDQTLFVPKFLNSSGGALQERLTQITTRDKVSEKEQSESS